jgi:hypothetical protein
MSKFFKKLGNDISSPFKKAGGAISGMFKKGGDIARGVSHGLGTVSKVLGTVGKVGGQILNNPLVKTVGMAAAPELYVGAQALTKGASGLSKIAGAGSHLTDVDSYKKSHLENVGDAVKRAQDLSGAVNAFV